MLIRKTCRVSGFAAAAALTLVLAANAFAIEFSADMVQRNAARAITGKICIKGSKIRQEVVSGATPQITIRRPDKNLAWQIFPKTKTYMVVSQKIISGMDDPVARANLKKMAKVKVLGKQTVNGYVCTKTQYTLQRRVTMVLTEWYADKLKHIIKMEIRAGADASTIEYKNIKLGGVPDSKFELPRGYRKVPTPKGPVVREPGS